VPRATALNFVGVPASAPDRYGPRLLGDHAAPRAATLTIVRLVLMVRLPNTADFYVKHLRLTPDVAASRSLDAGSMSTGPTTRACEAFS
jgi:hypothetical protein